MATVNTDVCNLAASRLGQKTSVDNIDTPDKPIEKVFAKWWDTARRTALKEIMPSCAIGRRTIALRATTPDFGYSNEYLYPSDIVKILGVGQSRYKQNNFAVEKSNGATCILSDEYDGEALKVRVIEDVTDVSSWSDEFVDVCAWYLAYFTNMEITQDVQKQTYLEQVVDKRKREAASLSSQENKPIRVNRSRFKESRTSGFPSRNLKK